MSRYFKYKDVGTLTVTDIIGLKRWIQAMKLYEVCNAEDLSNLLQLKYYPDPENNTLRWTVEFGEKIEDKDDDVELNTYINHFSPDDCTMQIFFAELSKYVAPFSFCVFDEEWPVLETGGFAWQIVSCGSGKISVTQLQLTKTSIEPDVEVALNWEEDLDEEELKKLDGKTQ